MVVYEQRGIVPDKRRHLVADLEGDDVGKICYSVHRLVVEPEAERGFNVLARGERIGEACSKRPGLEV